MNCFRFVSLKYWTQHKVYISGLKQGCELLSICIFEILNTAYLFSTIELVTLWIAFDLYLWNIEHSSMVYYNLYDYVVNCFRFVSLKYWTQLVNNIEFVVDCCELLSICIFEILNTALEDLVVFSLLLWIAFDLYLWNIEHSRTKDYTII